MIEIIELLGTRHPLTLRWSVGGQIATVDKSIFVGLPSCAGSVLATVVPPAPYL